jgi:hypothetical protein
MMVQPKISRVTAILLALLLLVGFTATVAAQEGGPVSISAVNPPAQTSFALVQNLSTTATANVTVQFWSETNTSTTPDAQLSDTIAANSAKNFSPGNVSSLPDGWRGSMVISSDQQIVATVVNYGFQTAHSIYEGFDSNKASNDVLLPSVHWNPAGQESLIAIQNIQSSPITVNVTYFNNAGTAILGPTQYTIPGNVSKFLNAISDCASCPGGPSGGAGVPEGSARVTTTNAANKVAVTVTEFLGNTAYAYDGIAASAAGKSYLLPSVHRNLAGQFTFALVQNTSTTQATDVTIEYRNPSGTVTDTFTQNIPASGSFNFRTPPGSPGEPVNFPIEGSAKVTSATSNIVVSVVETVINQPYAYNGARIDAGNTSATPNLLFPSVHRNPGGQFSFILVSNESPTTTADCSMTFKDNVTGNINTFAKSIPGNGSFNFITVPGAIPEDPTNLGNEGSARIACTGSNVIGVVVETVFGVPGVYEAFGSN